MKTSTWENDSTEKIPVGYRAFWVLVSATRTRDLVARTKEEIICQLFGHYADPEDIDSFVRSVRTEDQYKRDLADAERWNQQRDRAYAHWLDRKEWNVESTNIFASQMDAHRGITD